MNRTTQSHAALRAAVRTDLPAPLDELDIENEVLFVPALSTSLGSLFVSGDVGLTTNVRELERTLLLKEAECQRTNSNGPTLTDQLADTWVLPEASADDRGSLCAVHELWPGLEGGRLRRPVNRDPVSVEDYLAFEEAAATKHEYVNGFIYAMAGASDAHVH